MATSYTNPGGSGLRYHCIVATQDVGMCADPSTLLNGVYAQYSNWFTGGAVSGKYLRFDFGQSVVIDEATLYQSGSADHGTFQWQGSNDESNWTNIGSSAVFGGTSPAVQTALNGNTTAYRYYQIYGVSGNTTCVPYVYQIDFKIEDGLSGYFHSISIGDRDAAITVSTDLGVTGSVTPLVDGTTTGTAWAWWNTACANKFLKFDLGVNNDQIIVEAKFVQNNTSSHGTYKWQGSNDDSSWTDIGSSFVLGGATTQVITELSGNTTSYRYYRMLGISGNNNDSSTLYEFLFKVASALVSTTLLPTTLVPTTLPPTTLVPTTLAPSLGVLVGGKLVNDSILFRRLVQ
jgi:hypothetical protein